MLTCKEISHAYASGALEAAGVRRRLAVHLHLLLCRYCRRYAAQIRALDGGIRQLLREQTPDDARTLRLREAILSRRDDEETHP